MELVLDEGPSLQRHKPNLFFGGGAFLESFHLFSPKLLINPAPLFPEKKAKIYLGLRIKPIQEPMATMGL